MDNKLQEIRKVEKRYKAACKLYEIRSRYNFSNIQMRHFVQITPYRRYIFQEL